ncbi:MAG: hypothetical protein ACOX25_00980 [Caldicoprobacterales bacterium]|jgi:hypothetical protein|nr:hypothetical protein [Clostridiales bacterium]
MKSRKKKQTYEFVDDGRVIANMNIDGMPRSIIRRRAFDEFGMTSEKRETVKLTRRESWSVFFGTVASHVIFAIAVFGSLALFILFCIKVWFR